MLRSEINDMYMNQNSKDHTDILRNNSHRLSTELDEDVEDDDALDKDDGDEDEDDEDEDEDDEDEEEDDDEDRDLQGNGNLPISVL